MNIPQAFTMGATVASATTYIAQSAVTDGLDPTTGWAGGIVIAGVAVFLFFDRREQVRRKEENSQRRAEDEKKDQKIRDLEAEVQRLNETIRDDLRRRLDEGG